LNVKISREWAAPLAIGAFGLMSVTGLLMFFDLDTGFNNLAHEWLSWVMVTGVAAHAAVNWPALIKLPNANASTARPRMIAGYGRKRSACYSV
jgi:hypothetical protein